jgi:HD-GYP domain-containing protein (c-di-GMP phosphodiesterase class II)
MSDTQVLLSKIAAVRERLEKAQVHGPRPSGSSEKGPPLLSALVASLPAIEEPDRARVLEESIHRAARHGELLDGALQELADAAGMKNQPARLPRQLTPRAHRLLEEGRKLLTRLRTIDAQMGSNDILDDEDALTGWHRETVAMVDVALHIVQAFPDSASDQLRLCEGLEVILRAVGERVAILVGAVEKRRHEISGMDTLADLLVCLEAGRPIELKPFAEMAEAILAEARQAGPLRFHYPFDIQTAFVPLPLPLPDSGTGTGTVTGRDLGHYSVDAHWVARSVACHSLIVAQVMARIIQAATEWNGRLTESIIAALIHDVGMLRVPGEILVQKDPLTIEQKREIERHAEIGAELTARLPACPAWLIEAAGGHHERLDGTGYPKGLKESAIGSFTRLVAVCDVYAAMVAPRPYRPARETRTALTDTLLLADQGLLDRDHAERLLQLSFYPVGSVVELADGAVGVVVAGPMGQRNLDSPARPVVALLIDSHGQPLARTMHLDLSRWEGRSIVRSLALPERKRLLGKQHPELL